MSDVEQVSRYARSREVLKLFGTSPLVAAAVCVVVTVISHWRLGAASPGVLQLGHAGLSYWFAVIFLVFWFIPTIRAAFLVWRLKKIVAPMGLSWNHYLALPEDKRDALREQYGLPPANRI